MEANTYIKPSQIHGLGLFARHTIEVGEQIQQGKADFDTYRDLWIAYVKYWKVKSFNYHFGYCMINHSDKPNVARVKNFEDIVAIRRIVMDEEITEDYFKLPDEHNPFLGINIMEMIYRAKSSRL